MYEAPTSPQSIGGVLDSGFRLFRAAFSGTFFLAGASAFVAAAFSRYWTATLISQPNQVPSPGILLNLVVSAIIVYAFIIVTYVAIIARVDATAQGREMTLGEAFTVGRRRALPWFGFSLLYGLAILAGLMLLVVPGIILSISLMFGFYAVVTENMGPIESMKYSRHLVRGHWWRTAAIATIIVILISVVYMVLAFVSGIAAVVNPGAVTPGAQPWLIELVAGPVITAVVGPLSYSLFMTVFNDLQLRLGGADIAARIAATEA